MRCIYTLIRITVNVQCFEAESFVYFIDEYSVTKLFLQYYLCTRHVICCERMQYETYPPTIP